MGFRKWFFAPLMTDLINSAHHLGRSLTETNIANAVNQRRITEMAKTLADVQAQNATILDALHKNTDLTDSIKTAFNGLRSQIDDLTQQIADLKAAGGASPDDLQALFDQGNAMLTSIDADNLAEAAISGTPAEGIPAVPPAPVDANAQPTDEPPAP